MSKKVLMINGSARKKNTYNVLLQLENIMKNNNFEVEIINLFDYELKDCIGCEVCVKFEKCHINDDLNKIMDKMIESDAIILSSPVYMGSVTSKLKTLMDRTNEWIHKNKLAGKPMMFVTTTNATGTKATKKLLKVYANGLGVRKSIHISRVGKKMKEPVRENEIKKFFKIINQDKKFYKPKMDEIVMFNVSKVLAMYSTGNDHKYWEDNNLLDKRYYFPCKFSLHKKLFSKFIFKVLSKVMK